MEYYRCPIEDLIQEARRRGYTRFGNSDQLSEGLQRDEEARGSDATTVSTVAQSAFVPRGLNLSHTAEFGKTVLASHLVDEKIVYWTMNTFFPTLQLFFESGRSCTIDGGHSPGATIGLDPALRFKLTDSTHEEDGRLVKSTLPERFPHSGTGLIIKQALLAQRTSVVTRRVPNSTHVRIVTQVHTVVGLRLKGMSGMAYVWAKVDAHTESQDKSWGDVRIAGLRDDVPIPFLCFPERETKPGGRITVVVKDSLLSGKHSKGNKTGSAGR